jgi:hypothetical protein
MEDLHAEPIGDSIKVRPGYADGVRHNFTLSVNQYCTCTVIYFSPESQENGWMALFPIFHVSGLA